MPGLDLLEPQPLEVAEEKATERPVYSKTWTKQFANMLNTGERIMAGIDNNVPLLDQGESSLWPRLPGEWQAYYLMHVNEVYKRFSADEFSKIMNFMLRHDRVHTTDIDTVLYPYCPRVEYDALEDKVWCKFFATPRDAIEGRYTQQPLGRAVRTLLPTYNASDSVLARWVIDAEYNVRPPKLQLAVTRAEIRQLYKSGPNSCMYGEDKNGTGIHPDTGEKGYFHPCEAYVYPFDRESLDVDGSNGVAFAYFGNLDRATGRAIVRHTRDGRKYFGRVYGDERLRQDLQKLGYVHKERIIDGARLSLIRSTAHSELIVPYLDGCSGFSVRDGGLYADQSGYTISNSSSGRATYTEPCVHCGGSSVRQYEGWGLGPGEQFMCARCASGRDLTLCLDRLSDDVLCARWVSRDQTTRYNGSYYTVAALQGVGIHYCDVCERWHDGEPPRSARCRCYHCVAALSAEWVAGFSSPELERVETVCESCLSERYVLARLADGGAAYRLRERAVRTPDGAFYYSTGAALAHGWHATVDRGFVRGAAFTMEGFDDAQVDQPDITTEEEDYEEGEEGEDDDIEF